LKWVLLYFGVMGATFGVYAILNAGRRTLLRYPAAIANAIFLGIILWIRYWKVNF
jgi:hypothetical protein